MPAVINCPKCKTQFKLPDKMIGKAIKCSSCGTAFKTKSPVAKSQQGGQATANPQPPTAELAKLGLDGPLRRQPDVFASAAPVSRQAPDLLGNLAAEPGFGLQSDREPVVTETAFDGSQDEFMQNPAIRAKKNKRSGDAGIGGKKKSIPPYYEQVWFLLVVAFSAFFLVVMLVSLFAPSIGAIAMLAFLGAFGLASAVVAVWNLVQCCHSADNAIEIVLLLLVPFYIIYFWIKHWTSVWQSAMASLSFTMTMISCVAISLVVALICQLSGLEMPSFPEMPEW